MQRRLITLIAISALALGLAACGSSDKESDSGSPNTTVAGAGAPTGEAGTITIKDFKFSVGEVKAGETVTVKNEDNTAHTVTADDNSFNVSVDGGESKTFTAPDSAGAVPFHCNIHQYMKANLTVT